jgi:hypothetical protein
VPPVRRPALPWSLAASARLDAEGLMAVAAVLADGLKIGLQSIEVLGIALRRFDVVGKFGDCRLEVAPEAGPCDAIPRPSLFAVRRTSIAA